MQVRLLNLLLCLLLYVLKCAPVAPAMRAEVTAAVSCGRG
jgi:hypothetical protein